MSNEPDLEEVTGATKNLNIDDSEAVPQDEGASDLAEAKEESLDQEISTIPEEKKKKKKSVGFAPPPEEDLAAHHKILKEKELQEIKSNPFHKIPPELAYLENKNRTPGPKPLPSFSDLNKFDTDGSKKNPSTKAKRTYGNADVGDLRALAIKVISVANKQTEVFNFNNPTIDRPISSNTMIVDVQYAGLNSYDLGKINKYAINVSEVKIGIGYEFVGFISDLGSQFVEYDSVYKIGQPVVGILNPYGRKGSLSTSLLVNPKRDVVVPVTEEVLEKLKHLKVEIDDESKEFGLQDETDDVIDSTNENTPEIQRDIDPADAVPEQPNDSQVAETTKPSAFKKLSNFEIDPELTPLSKLVTFPVLYSRAKAALADSHANFIKNGSANVLINGADTNLGLTIFQLLNSSVYSFLERLNIILVTRESSKERMEAFVKKFTKYDPTKTINVKIVPFDSVNTEDLVLQGEKTPILYKKPNLFACEILDAMFYENGLNKSNINDYKLDTIIDIVGGSKYFQTSSIKYSKIQTLAFPFISKLESSTKLQDILNTTKKEPFLIKILKPKSKGSNYISCCKYGRPNPSYLVDDLIQEGGNGDYVNPWSMKWTANIANSWLSSFNYFNHTELEIKQRWIEEGLQLLLDGEIKFKIDDYCDWRNNYKKVIAGMKKEDKKSIFEIETF
ncbi:hypothetical protein CLIB1423_08S00958 [[Candida] railenensis]|uniref:Uncharacterized protein n=1 Tax=[Candida] railenensis TaxID=45579 RepID=A0A9P0QQG9_9ASCO|nr:hypothetical protein CLIB1423_08S00958 [[Candida] railenensis]